MAGGKALTIQSVTGDKVVFTPAISEGRHNYMLYRKGASLIYNDSGNWVVKGVAHDEGIGVKEVKVTVTVNSSSETLTIPESSLVSSLSGLWAWEGQIDLSTLSDGKGSLSYEITDKLGNKYTPSSIEVRVKNKPVKISKVILQTEIGGQPVKTDKTDPAETDPKTTVTKTSDAQLDQTVTVGSKNFAFKSKTASKIKVEFDGGQGSVRYRLRKGGTVLKEITLPNLPSGIIGDHPLTSGDEIDLKDHLAAIGNSNGTPTTITLELWDEAHGYTQGTDSSWAKVDITTLFDALDQTDPTVVILPFHWNSEDNNSLYKNKRDNGHVEIKETGNSQVSGKVTLRGFAYDNIELNEITATLPNSTALTVTATRQANGTWSSDKTMTDGAELTVTKLGADYLGYYVAWQLDWDTEKATVEAAAKEITVQAKDGANNTSALPPAPPSPPYSGTDMPTKTTVARSEVKKAENAVFAGTKRGQFVVFKNGETQYLTRLASVDGNEVTLEDAVPKEAADAYMYDYTANKSAVTVNVVPYITGIENAAGEGLSNSVIRGSDGAYSMNYSTSEKMIVKGFNLKPASGGTTTATIGSTSPAVSDVTETSIKVSKKAESGALVVKVGSVESINNMVDLTKPYNHEKDITNPSSNLWNAKRELVFWENKQVCKNTTDQTFYYPSMVMSGEQPIFAYCNNNDGFTYRTTDDDASDQRGGLWYARNAVLAKTSDNKYMILSNEDNFTQKYSGYLYLNSNDANDTAQIGYDNYSYNRYPSGAGFIELCNTSYRNSAWNVPSLNRFKYPSLIVAGVNDSAQIYISYYDSKAQEIRFFAFKKTGAHTTNLTEAGQIHGNPRGLAENGTLVVSGTNGGKSSEHTAMAKVGAGIYIAYYDAASTTLKLAYSKTPLITGMTGLDANKNGLANTAAAWNTLEVDNGALTGQYVSMTSSGTKLYIAYHDASNAALKLAVVETTGTVSVTSKVIVDAYQSVGYKTGITMVGDVPYISYYNNAQAGTKSSIKVAYPKDTASIGLAGADANGSFTGNWIARYIPSMGVPNVSIPEFNRVMINSYKVSTIDKPVLAWLGDPFIEYTKMK